jgi:hypothetical protein
VTAPGICAVLRLRRRRSGPCVSPLWPKNYLVQLLMDAEEEGFEPPATAEELIRSFHLEEPNE